MSSIARRRFGRLRKLPSGRWQARYSTDDGVEHTAPDTFTTKTDAARWLDAVEVDINRGQWRDPRGADMTLHDLGAAWIAEHPDLRPRTRELYEQLWRCYVEPRLGSLQLGRLTPAAVKAWNRKLIAERPAATTPAKAYRLLRAMLNTAVADDVIVRNPCTIRGAGQERSDERTPPTLAEVERLAESVPSRYAVLVRLAAMTGCRWGELVALRRHRVDPLHGRLQIVEQLVEVEGGHISVGPPKTSAGVRQVSIPPHLLPAVVEHMAAYSEQTPDGLLFTGPKGAYLTRRNFTVTWTKAKKKAGVDAGLHFHDLRHLAATLAAGVPGTTTKDLMSRLGHASARAALRYQHSSEDRDDALAVALSGMVAGFVPLVESTGKASAQVSVTG